MGAHVLASSLRSHAAEVVASPVGGRNTRRPVGRTRKNGRADTVISWAGRARPIRPAPCAWYLSFLRLFFPAGAGRCARHSGRKAGSFGWFRVFRATAQHGPRWGGWSVGAFPGGPAGRWRVSFAQPAVVRAGFWPLPLSGCWRCRSPLRRLWVAAQPVIEIFSSGGGARLLLRPLGRGWGFASLVLPSARPPMGHASVLWGGVGGGRRPPPPVSAGPPDGTCPRQVWRVHARMQGARRGPRGRGPSALTVYRVRTQICGNSKCSTRIGSPGLAELRRGLVSRLRAGKTAQGPLPPALGWFRALPAPLLALKTLPQIGQYRQYSRTGYRQEGQTGPKGMITIATSYSVRFIGLLPLTFPSSRGNILSKSVIPLWPAVPYHGVRGFNLLKTGFGLPPC